MYYLAIQGGQSGTVVLAGALISVPYAILISVPYLSRFNAICLPQCYGLLQLASLSVPLANQWPTISTSQQDSCAKTIPLKSQ